MIAYLLLLVSAAWLVSVSIFILVRPHLALSCLGKFASTNLINYTELSLRMISGFAFIQYADSTRHARIFFIFGCFLVVSAGILSLTPRRWHAAYASYWSRTLTPPMARVAASFSFVAGVLLLIAIH